MAIKDLVKKIGNRRENLPARRNDYDPFHDFQRDMNRLFDNFFEDFSPVPYFGGSDIALSSFSPKVDVSETDKEVKVSAELPGMDEKDITVEVNDSSVTIRGEKKAEHEEKGKNWYKREQSYGSFHRVLPLPSNVDGGKAKAQFKKGMLTVTAPKREDKENKRKTITIETK